MNLFSNYLKKPAIALLSAMMCLALVSCADQKEEKQEAEPVKQPPKPVAPTLTKPAPDALDAFRIPKDETLPTNAQLDQGAESSIGTVGSQAPVPPDSAPSTAAKPPVPAPAPPKPDEDQLAPPE